MKRFTANPKSALRYFVAALSGLILTAAFPNWDIAGAAWVAPGLMLFSALGVNRKQAFRLGFVAGLAHFLSSLYWLLLIPYTFHGIPLGPGAGWLLLGAYCALFTASWVWGCWWLAPKSANALSEILTVSLPRRAVWAFACAAIWVALEFLRAHLFSGFPWNLLGNSQYKLIPLIQIASYGGVYAVSFLVVWTSVAIGLALLGIVATARAPRSGNTTGIYVPRFGSLGDVLVPFLVVGLAVNFGSNRIFSKPSDRGVLKVALIQPSIPQTVIWDPSGDAARFQKVVDLSREALASKPQVLVWPESAFPGFSETNFTTLTNLAVQHHVWIILCADDADPPKALGDPIKYYNSSFLISPEGEVVSSYRKKRLVIFGEYVPLTKWLPFLKWFTPIDGGYTSGPGPVQFQVNDPFAKTSVLICFEDVFPHEAREHVNLDTDFLLNLTNDGWFGEGAAQWQQAISGVFRAVENGVPLVRCTNNGLTCWIDALGRIRQIGNPENIYGAGFMVADIPLRSEESRTFYNQHGNWLPWGCSFYVLFAVLRTLLQRRFRKSEPVLTPKVEV